MFYHVFIIKGYSRSADRVALYLHNICSVYLTSTDKMDYSPTESCPVTHRDWSDRARDKCSRPDSYHCLQDQFSRLGEVCVEPIWVKQGKRVCVLQYVIKLRSNVGSKFLQAIFWKLLCLSNLFLLSLYITLYLYLPLKVFLL